MHRQKNRKGESHPCRGRGWAPVQTKESHVQAKESTVHTCECVGVAAPWLTTLAFFGSGTCLAFSCRGRGWASRIVDVVGHHESGTWLSISCLPFYGGDMNIFASSRRHQSYNCRHPHGSLPRCSFIHRCGFLTKPDFCLVW